MFKSFSESNSMRLIFSFNFWNKIRNVISKPVIKLLVMLNVHPNLITSLGLFTGIISVVFLFSNHFYFILFMITTLLLDGLDGTLAEASNKRTKLGSLYDKISDTIYGLLLIIKSYYFIEDPLLVTVSLSSYLGHIILAKKSWSTRLRPTTTFIKIFYALKIYNLGLLLQTFYAPFALMGYKLTSRHIKK